MSERDLISANLARELAERGWDNERLSAKAGVSVSEIQTWRADPGEMSLVGFVAIARAFGIQPHMLVMPGGAQ